MKDKIICIVIITSICFAFSSCAKTSDNDHTKNETDSSYSQSTTNNKKNSVSLEYDGKKVNDIILNLLDSKTSMGTENAEDLLNIEELSKPVDVNLNMQIGKIIIVYTDNSEYEFGKIFIGTKNNYYLQIERDGKTNIYELNDEITH